MNDTATTVAIVGAGPVGKTAALLLAAYGIRSTLIERRGRPSDEPKAISIDDEALRVYSTAGVLDDLLPIIVPGLGTRYHDRNGDPVFLAGSAQSGRFGYPYKNPFAQPDLERVLHDAVSSHPLIDARFGAELVGLRELPEHNTLTLRTTGGDETTELVADFVIGADGGRSAVRTLTGIPMSGHTVREDWIVIDSLNDPHTERFGLHYGTPDRPHVIVPGLNGRCRYEFRLFEGEGVAGEPPSIDFIRELVGPYRDLDDDDIERAVIYTFHALNADTYQTARVFLVGDAAHMMPPFAGQGLNSGIRDAMNLCWKIAGTLNGQLSSAVLASYTEERRPHAGAMIRLSERLRTITMATHPRVAAHRDRIIGEALADPERRQWFESMRYRPTARYTGTLTAGRDEHTGTQLNQPRAFDATAGRIALLDEITGDGWAIVGVNVPTESWRTLGRFAQERGIRRVHAQLGETMPHGLDVDALIVDIDGTLDRALEPWRTDGGVILLRPDRFIAGCWLPTDAETGLATTSPWFASA